MKRYSATVAVGAGLLGASGLGAGCTLVNTFGQVLPDAVAEAGLNDGTTSDVSLDAGTDAAAAGDADGGPAPVSPGLIVIGGTAIGEGGERLVLTALSPATGTEYPRAREPMVVSAIQYDGARDIWYIFESGGPYPFPRPGLDAFYLHTRTFDPRKGEWTELGKFQIPAGESFATTTVLNQRVSYIAYGEGDAGVLDAGSPSSFSLVTLDTSNPAAVTVDSIYPIWTASPNAVVGVRLGNGSVGGKALLGAVVKGLAQLTPVDVTTNSPSAGVPIVGISGAAGQVGFGRVTDRDTRNVMYAMAITRAGISGPATLSIFDPLLSDPDFNQLKSIGTFPFGDTNINAPAFSDCDQVAFVLGKNSDLSVHAVPLAGLAAPADILPDAGPPVLAATSAPTGHSGQGVYFEPYTKTVLTPFSDSGNFALTAFKLGGTPTSPTLIPREAPEWVPPVDIRPNFVGTAIPYPPVCSTDAGP